MAVRWRAVAGTLAIARDDGTALQLRRRARGPKLAFGDVVVTYRDHRESSGLRVPFAIEATCDGEPMAAQTLDAIELDPELPPGCFARPER